MALTSQQIQEMDRVSGLSSEKVSQMDAVVNSQQKQGGWEDVLPGVGGIIGGLLQPQGLVTGAATAGPEGLLGKPEGQR